MTDLQRNTNHQCQCARCRASRALDVLRALPSLPDDGRAALDTIEAALNELEESGFARWEAMNDVATAAGLNWMDATRQDIVDAIKQARARVAELEAQLAAQGWRDFAEHPPIGEPIQITTVIDAVREEPDGLYRIGHTSEWQAWRPTPQESPPEGTAPTQPGPGD